jgi:broad specificity phosphatase PhoE
MRRLAVLAAIAAFLSSAAAFAQKAVLVVRHGEKISEEDERLTEAGRARSARLAEMLRKSDIAAIYSTDTERTIGTAQPLADALGLKIRIYDTQPAKGNADFEKLVGRLRDEVPDGVVLVVGHSNTVPLILRALGCLEEVTIASGEFDNLFIVVPEIGGRARLVRLRY